MEIIKLIIEILLPDFSWKEKSEVENLVYTNWKLDARGWRLEKVRAQANFGP